MSRTVDSLDALWENTDLADVVLYEVSGRRRDGFDLSDLPSDSGETDMRVLHNCDGEQIRVRCQLRVATRDGVYAVDAAALFKLRTPPMRVSPELVQSFAHRVGVPAIYPYLRVELHMAARRLGLKPPILQLLKPETMSGADRTAEPPAD